MLSMEDCSSMGEGPSRQAGSLFKRNMRSGHKLLETHESNLTQVPQRRHTYRGMKRTPKRGGRKGDSLRDLTNRQCLSVVIVHMTNGYLNFSTEPRLEIL